MGSHRAPARPLTRPRAAAATTLSLLIMALTTMALLPASPAAAATGTYVRLAQLTEDLAGADLVLSSVSDPQRSVTIPGVGYGELSSYHLVQPGDYVVGIQPPGAAATQFVTTTLNAMTGSAYTLAAVGSKTASGLSVFADDLTPPDPGNGRVRVIDAAPPEPTLDVRWAGGEPFALGLPCGDATDYRMVPAGPATLSVGRPGGPAVDLPITVAANQVASIVLVNRGGALAADVRVDAEGPAAMPPGPIKAGFGGAAERPGGPAGTIAFGVLAAAAAAYSAYLARRARDVPSRAG